jgi:rare lipoprotein A (peptidoglycan hydrolase)
VRTRIVVAFAALMAASALVAVPAPAGSHTSSPERPLDPAQLSAVTIALPKAPAVTTALEDTASRSTTSVGPATAFAEPGARPAASGRPRVSQPAPARGSLTKNAWRFDPDISWFGPGLYGNGTACGKKLTKDLVGVAHRTLPCGTLVTFRYKGRTVTAPVVDRGPYVSGRTWDMTKGLCAALGHCFTGTIEWRLGGG